MASKPTDKLARQRDQPLNEEQVDAGSAAHWDGQPRLAGVLPFRISVPRSGRPYPFGRLLTTAEPIVMEVRYVTFPPILFPLTLGGVGFAGLAWFRGRLRRLW